jgi:hypothetical protein
MRITIFALVCAILGTLLGVALAYARLGEPAAIVLSDSDGGGGAAIANVPVPRVSVDQETFDFGTMERHASQSHDFLFTNEGDAPLELTVGETTCKCTIGEVPEKLVQPGQTVPVTLSWTAETDEPQFRQTAEIHTNDPLRRHLNLMVVGRVSEASSYSPKSFLFGDVPVETSETAEVTIVSRRNEPFEILNTEFIEPATAEHFEVEIDALAPEEYPSPDVHAGYRVRLTAKPTLPFGRIGGWLRITTDLANLRGIEVPISGDVVSDVAIYGPGYNRQRSVLDLGHVNGSEGIERHLFVVLRGERGVAIQLKVRQTDPEYLSAELGERKSANENAQVPLIVRVPPGSPKAVHMAGREGNPGRIVIETDHPSVPELTIDVQFTVQ